MRVILISLLPALLCSTQAPVRLRISAQAHLEGFYTRLGFVPGGDVYDDAGIPHREMRFG